MSCAKRLPISLALALLAASCTVAPKPVASRAPSWDSGAQTSGLLQDMPDHQFLITPRARARYNGLVALYGTRICFNPPVTNDFGVTPHGTNFIISAEALEIFATMTRWNKLERTAPTR
jgi:hypothetical protein